MKRVIVCVLLCCGFLAPLFGGDAFPFSPAIMATGGAGGATASGYDSLFSNPAGFAAGSSSFTLAALQPWVYTLPERAMGLASAFSGDDSSGTIRDIVADDLASNGFGVGGSAGMGWVGSGLGLGFSMAFDSYLYDTGSGSLAGDSSLSVSAVLGYAVPISLGSSLLYLGADVRPTVRIDSSLSDAEAEAFLDSLAGLNDPLGAISGSQARYGVGFAIDAGAILEMGRLSLGLSVRDLGGTRFAYESGSFGEALDDMVGGKLPPDSGDEEYVPMKVNAGLSLQLFQGRIVSFFNPVLYGEVRDATSFIDSLTEGEVSPLLYTHCGADLELFGFLNLRAGLYQGYATAGLGIDLPLLDLQAAYFTRELGTDIGEKPSSGLTLEASLRF